MYRADIRVLLVGKVNGNQAAHCGSRLIHQTAGLAKKYIFRVLADLRNFRLGHPAAKKQMFDDCSDQHLKGGGGA